MPDTKITALTAIGANPIIPSTFPIPMVDLTDTSMAASGTTKKVTVNQILGAGGTATLASATITGDLTVDTSTLKVDSANNRVGINTATPVAGIALHVCDNVFGANLSSGVRFGNSGNNYYFDQLIVTDGSSNPAYQLNFATHTLAKYLYGGGANYWEWYANNTLGMTLNTTGLGVGVVPITQARLSLKSSAVSPLNLVLQNRDASQNWQFYVDGVVVGDGILTINNGTSSVMQMTPTGNVGIGVTPSAKLDVAGNARVQLAFFTGGTIPGLTNENPFAYRVPGGGLGLGAATETGTASPIIFYTGQGGVERVRVKGFGQVRFFPLSADPAGAEAGDVYYNSSSNKLKCYNGTTWNDLF